MKSTLITLEKSIITLIGNDPFGNLLKHPEKRNPLKTALKKRCRILNEMFVPTPQNIQRFIQVNKRLYTLTQKLYLRVHQMENQRTLISNPDFDDDYELEGRLAIPFNGPESVLTLPDDSYYGSHFAQMIECLDAAYPEPILHVHSRQTPLDDGSSWDEGPFQQYPEFKNITICYAVHDICTHRPYSIPDLLRLNDFWCEVELTAQSITTQDGTRQ